MKNKTIAVLWICTSLLLGGCAAASGNGTIATPPATTMPVPITATPAVSATAAAAERVEEYFPVLENVRYVYEGVGNEYASYISHTEFAEGNRLQLRIDNGGTVTSRVYKWENGRLERVLSVPESYVRENLLNEPETESEVLLQEPLAVGTAWDAGDGRRTITSTSMPVTTPAGNYHALEVTTQGKEFKTVDYYAKGVGLVKSIYQSGDLEVSSSLGAIERETPFLQVVRLYYPGTDGAKRYYREAQLTLPTNLTLAAAMEEAYKVEPGGKAGRVFSPGTRILNMSRDDENVVRLDLNQAFASEMNAGAAFETGVLRSVADTFGELYLSQKVLLTIEGKPFQSGHIALKEGETLAVEQGNAEIILD